MRCSIQACSVCPRSPGRWGALRRLHRTQWRVIFRAGSVTPSVGSFRLQLRDIVRAQHDSVGDERTIGRVLSDGAERRFLIWGIPSFLAALDAARGACVGDVLAQLQARAAERPDLLESHLRVSSKVAGWFARGPLHWVTRGAQRSSGSR